MDQEKATPKNDTRTYQLGECDPGASTFYRAWLGDYSTEYIQTCAQKKRRGNKTMLTHTIRMLGCITAIALLLVLTGSLNLGLPVARSQGANACGSTITESVTLTTDLLDCPSHGLIVEANDVMIDCAGHTIRGLGAANSNGIQSNGTTGVTIKNCVIENFTNGILIQDASDHTVADSTFRNAQWAGIHVRRSTNSVIQGSRFENGYFGAYLVEVANTEINDNNFDHNYAGVAQYGATQSSVIRNTVSGSEGSHGIYARNISQSEFMFNEVKYGIAGFTISENSHNNLVAQNSVEYTTLGIVLSNNVTETTMQGNDISYCDVGIDLKDGSNGQTFAKDNLVRGNTIAHANEWGMRVWPGATGNLIYDNYWENTGNVSMRTTEPNQWNVPPTAEANVVGGSVVAGNFWATPSGSGFSQTCSDAQPDGLCDTPIVLAADNVDAAPLSPYTPSVAIEPGPDGSGGPPTCGATVLADLTLTSDLQDCSEDGLVVAASNVTLDCNGFAITGAGSASNTAGIRSHGTSGVTIQNCRIENFTNGITLEDASTHTVMQNTLVGNKSAGLYVHRSTDNILQENEVERNGYGIYLLQDSNNVVDRNIVKNNSDVGIFLVQSTGGTLMENQVSTSGHGYYLLGTSTTQLLSNIATDNQSASYIITKDSHDNQLDLNQASGSSICVYLLNNVSSNMLTGNTIRDCASGIDIRDTSEGETFAHHNILMGNAVSNTTEAGIRVFPGAMENQIYNNIWINQHNAMLLTTDPNTWHMPMTEGPNMVGGPVMAGNVWSHPSGTGFSDTCTDTDDDGICDAPHMLATQNVDELPLSTRKLIDILTNGINYTMSSPTCDAIVTTNLTLETDLYCPDGNGLVIAADGISVDCGGHHIKGLGAAAGTAGIVSDGNSGVTLKNCVIEDFATGILLENATTHTVFSNTLTGNAQAIVITGESADVLSHTIVNNAVTNNAEGIVVQQITGTATGPMCSI